MENTGPSKAKKKTSVIPQRRKPALNIGHYKQQIQSLTKNVEALKHALDSSHETINHQNKLIANLQAIILSQQLPKTVTFQLETMEKAINHLSIMLAETKALLSAHSSNNSNLPILLPFSPDVNNIALSSESNDSAESKPLNSKPPQNKTASKSSKQTPSKTKSASKTSPTLHSNKKKNDSQTEIPKSSIPSFLNDELMQLPASTSKARPKLTARKRLPSKPTIPADLRIEQNNDSSDDDEPLIKCKRLKVKLQTPQFYRENRVIKLGDKSKEMKGDSNIENSDNTEKKNDLAEKKKLPPVITDSKFKDTLQSQSNSSAKRKANSAKSKKKESLNLSKNKVVEIKKEIIDIIESVCGSPKNTSRSESLAESGNSEEKSCDKHNGEMKPRSKYSRSRSSSFSSQICVSDILKNQPYVRLQDIFHSSKNIVDPIIKKYIEGYKTKTKKTDIELVAENSSKVNGISNATSSEDDDVTPIDLELECVEDDDVLILQNHVNETESPTKTDSGNDLDTFRITPSPEFIHNGKEEISIDAINNMLTKLCEENCSKNIRSDDRLVYAYS